MAPAAEPLLDPSFLIELEALRRMLRPRVASGGSGDRVGAARGGSAEFREHRAYAPGDDPRRIDWLAFARTGTPVVKQFHAEQDVVVRLLLDTSASFGMGQPSKLEHAKRLAAAIAYMALKNAHRVQLVRAAHRGRSELELFAPTRGQSGWSRVLTDLSQTRAGGTLDLPSAVAELVQRSPRPGVLVVLSDFLDPGPTSDALRRAAFAHHELTLVQVLATDELEPELEGDLTLEDVETQSSLELTVDAAALSAYRERLTGLFQRLSDTARTSRGTYVRTTPGDPLVEVIRKIARGVVEGRG
ncbi:MAG TPA: DUF58 domain-containing protein [Polyangiaceae bacterium]|nr:DUF58 domain-containing protein [Polyangiaceae bacterium]